ncbi:DUF4124 domain-containing protein [Thiobacillus sedimenti]|uniref:DUF4124 domain-containing protein n=1 Tax=Thiobacillus sedimenti TaxID=3110231 RepID=A0ABZ1CMQ5_9PROT|nr:DUF4124 domain-containing protein [Thiobacillus sp. SCUT-2]WRS40136.1 DUF4124 domain-containing protein [Thiobacillus sp. SCUT-2]
MRAAIVLPALAALALSLGAAGATLNKCIDARGRVTYSNLPCHDAREARTVDVDPAPSPAAPPASVQPRPSGARAASPAPKTDPAEPPRKQPVATRSMRQCDTLSDKLGRVLDKMDQARRNGYTQKQMDAWNLEAKEIERKKQRAGCF